MTILITGATGHVGRSLVSELNLAGVPLRALVRDADKARAVLPAGVEVAVGDFADPDSLASAVRGVKRLFLAAPNHPEQLDWEVSVIKAARGAGVKRVVKLSAHGARQGSPVAFWDTHAAIERHLVQAGMEWVVLRPTTFASTALASFNGSHLVAPAAGARVAFIDPADVAAVAAGALLQPRWVGRTLTLTGPRVHTFDSVALQLAALTSRPVRFIDVPEAAAAEAMTAAGASPWFADNVVRVFGELRAGIADLLTDDVYHVIRRPARPLSEALRVPLFASVLR